MKKGSGNLGKDNPMKPGQASTSSVRSVEGRVGYTQNETRFGPPKGAKSIGLPRGKK